MIPQLTKPKDGDIYYNPNNAGGINPGRANPNRIDRGLKSLPNCVSWVVGRFNAIGDLGIIKYLGAYYPYAMIPLAKRQGLKVVQYPSLGGCMVWTGGKTDEGHVAIVERINDDGSILTSESEYYGRAFAVFHRYGGKDGSWQEGCYWMRGDYKFAGCIVNPFIEKEEEMNYEKFCEYMDRYMEDLAKKTSSPWAKEALSWAKDEGLMVGDASGNQMPKVPLTTERAAVIMKAFYDKYRR